MIESVYYLSEFVIFFLDGIILWISEIQTEIVLSKREIEGISKSHLSMRKTIPFYVSASRIKG